ncbi:MAG: hypothetical protein ACQEXJ_07190 [Myxococcota bacterium]
MMPGAMSADPRAAAQALVRFASAYAFLLAGLATLAWSGDLLADGRLLDGPVVAGVHFLTLGWLSLSIFAALRVFGGVALGSPLESPRLGLVQWLAWLAGSTIFPLGLAFGSAWAIATGAGALVVGVAAFTGVAVPAYVRATRGRLTRAYLLVALASLWIVLALGVTAAILRAGFAGVMPPPGYFHAHLLVAIFGWVGATVVGVGAHLLPMFALSREPNEWCIRAAFPLFASVPVFGGLGAFFPALLPFGWGAAGLGSALWIVQVAVYARTRLRRGADSGLALAAAATGLLGLAWVALLAASLSLPYVALLVVGWLTLFTLGIYHRVVPFLVWFGRFSTRVGRGRVPMVSDLTDPRVAWFTAGGSLVGVVGWAAGLALGEVAVVHAGAALMVTAVAASLLQIRTLTRAEAPPRPAPKQEVLT